MLERNPNDEPLTQIIEHKDGKFSMRTTTVRRRGDCSDMPLVQLQGGGKIIAEYPGFPIPDHRELAPEYILEPDSPYWKREI